MLTNNILLPQNEILPLPQNEIADEQPQPISVSSEESSSQIPAPKITREDALTVREKAIQVVLSQGGWLTEKGYAKSGYIHAKKKKTRTLPNWNVNCRHGRSRISKSCKKIPFLSKI